MSKPKRTFMEFSPGRDTGGVMDEYARQMNILAEGLRSTRAPRPHPPEKARSVGERPRRSEQR